MEIIIMDLDDYFISKREEYIMDSFKFQSGDVLNNVSVEYMTFGTPKYDDNGCINNAIVYCHGSLEIMLQLANYVLYLMLEVLLIKMNSLLFRFLN